MIINFEKKIFRVTLYNFFYISYKKAIILIYMLQIMSKDVRTDRQTMGRGGGDMGG